MGEILAQEPHFSLQKKDIFRRIETMTPEKFKNWALYESVKKENATKDKIKNCDNDDTIKDGEEDKIKDGEKDKIKDGEKDKIKDEEDKDDDKNVDKKIKNDYKKIKNDDRNGAKDESFSKEDNEDDESDSENSKKAAIPPRRSLRKTPTRLLKAQMELLNKRKSAFFYESGKRRMPCFADEVLEELVSSRRLAVWLKQKEKRNGGKKRVYFATKKSIQWKSLSKSRLRIAPFSRRSKEEDEFFEIKDKNNMSPQEEQKLREQMNKKVSDQVSDNFTNFSLLK
ncbi:hypothetical protein MHBO_000571 [Bonamia ostreae]|uniref:Uncharacterized protein n=1 Tax=Bonamia ostreae TaxID=126728 RepID=A0ABV2AGP6_9EUKA